MVDCWMNGQCLIYIMSFPGAIGCNSHVLMSSLLHLFTSSHWISVCICREFNYKKSADILDLKCRDS